VAGTGDAGVTAAGAVPGRVDNAAGEGAGVDVDGTVRDMWSCRMAKAALAMTELVAVIGLGVGEEGACGATGVRSGELGTRAAPTWVGLLRLASGTAAAVENKWSPMDVTAAAGENKSSPMDLTGTDALLDD
jgi:hypothetical protein